MPPEAAVLDNPVIRDSEEDALRAAALAVDEGRSEPVPSVQPAEDHAPAKPDLEVKPEEGKSDSSEISPEIEKPKIEGERARDEQGRFKPTEEKTEEAKTEVKPESEYTKRKKEIERQENVLKNFQQEKEQFRAELAQERQRLAEERQQLQRQMPKQRNGDQPTAEEYEEVVPEFKFQAKQLREAGDEEEAKKFDILAERARDAAKAVRVIEQQITQKEAEDRFKYEWSQDAEKQIKEQPDLNKEGTPLFNAMARVFKEEPLLWRTEQGFTKARKIAELAVQAGRVSELEEENKKLRAETDRLNGVTRIDGSGPTSAPVQKKFEDMTLDEMEADLRKKSEALG